MIDTDPSLDRHSSAMTADHHIATTIARSGAIIHPVPARHHQPGKAIIVVAHKTDKGNLLRTHLRGRGPMLFTGYQEYNIKLQNSSITGYLVRSQPTTGSRYSKTTPVLMRRRVSRARDQGESKDPAVYQIMVSRSAPGAPSQAGVAKISAAPPQMTRMPL